MEKTDYQLAKDRILAIAKNLSNKGKLDAHTRFELILDMNIIIDKEKRGEPLGAFADYIIK